MNCRILINCDCQNCGRMTFKENETDIDPLACKFCLFTDFYYRCPVCNRSKPVRMSKNDWESINSEYYPPPMWTCDYCGVYYNPLKMGNIGEFEIKKAERGTNND